MSGISIILELARKNPSHSHSHQSLHSYGLFSAAAAAAVAASSRFFDGNLGCQWHTAMLGQHGLRTSSLVGRARSTLCCNVIWEYIAPKNVPKSAARKAQRGMPTIFFIWSVSRTTFRGYLLGVLASWLVQVSIETYRCLSRVFCRKKEDEDVDPAKEFELLAKKAGDATIKYTASLVFASIGAGIGAALIRPSLGQWIGCAIGDLAGPVVVSFCFEKYLHADI